jgi:hypothetical protein
MEIKIIIRELAELNFISLNCKTNNYANINYFNEHKHVEERYSDD